MPVYEGFGVWCEPPVQNTGNSPTKRPTTNAAALVLQHLGGAADFLEKPGNPNFTQDFFIVTSWLFSIHTLAASTQKNEVTSEEWD